MRRGQAIVLGAGVVGITTAWALAESGWRVSLLDARGVAQGTSLRNGGQLSYRYVAPLADAGVPLKALRWLLDPDGPLRWRPQADPVQWTWLGRFLALCNGADNRATAARLARLGQFSRVCLHDLMHGHGVQGFAWEQAGKLVLYRSAAALGRAAAAMDTSQECWDQAQCMAQEPALDQLGPKMAGGIYSEDEAVADCHAFCLSLMDKLQAHPNFMGLLLDTVQRLVPEGARVSVMGQRETYGADALVLAAGIASRSLALPLGLKLPLYPLKGYSLDLPIESEHVAPRASITDFERKVLYARIGSRLRVAAMVDLVGQTEAIDQRRLQSLLRVAQSDMPRAGDYARAQPWAGLRPATPSGAPIIGPSGVRGLWLNLGQGALGFTFAAGSAQLLASQMNGQETPEMLQGLSFSLESV
ncbi:MAG: FAD-dependent oxidoreductase [Betaproteobacteria bacterium]|nr:FAD-dependent oxidoreductase [Betaproteobacteria bacterium]